MNGGKDPLLAELERDLGIQEIEEKPKAAEVTGSSDRTFHDLYSELLSKGEIIVIINGEDETRVRENLSVVKAKHMAKLKDNKIPVEPKKLQFIRHEGDIGLPKGQIKLTILLAEPKRIKIHKIIVPTD
jgi:hypothetical protein